MSFIAELEASLDAKAAREFGPWERRSLLHAMQRVGMTAYPPVTGDPNGERCGGCLCEICGHKYADHPMDWRVIGYGDVPFLNVLCDGRRAKL